MRIYSSALFITIYLAVGSLEASAAEPEFAAECAVCHQLQAADNADLESRQQRLAPPLYFAGNKFRQGWLVSWLQNPQVLRPAGDYPARHTETVEGEDWVQSESLTHHPVLTATQAETAAQWLMTLSPHSDLISTESEYEPGNVSLRMGGMDFVKFKGCGACHKDMPEYGGLSGPELYTAWQRLQPGFIVSYIRDPSAWEPYSLMPMKNLNTSQIHKLANYLRTIGEEE